MSTEGKLEELKNSECVLETDLTKESFPKCRHVAAAVGFFVIFSMYALRINMSVGIVAMVNNTASIQKGSSSQCPDLLPDRNESVHATRMADGVLNWSPEVQGYVLCSYAVSYVLVQVPSAILIERYGCKWFMFWGTLLAALATLIIPAVAQIHAGAVMALQLVRGTGQGCFLTACATISANWFPKTERGLLYTLMCSGSSFGMVLGSIFSGLLCESVAIGGWPSSFYVFGIAGLILAAAIVLFFHETPGVHPRISQAELKYILSNQENILTIKRPKAPWDKICRSVPVYALAVGCFGQMWAISQFLIVHSTFLGTVLHYPIKENGYLSALPFLLMFLFTYTSGWLSNFLVRRKCMSVDCARKFWTLMSCIGFSACLLGVYFSGCNRLENIIFSSFSVGFVGFGLSGVWITSTDMTPTFSATVKSICSVFGLTPIFILPVVVGYMTNEMQTIEQWNKVFFMSIAVVMSSGVIFAVFGSANIQPWNYVKDDQEHKGEIETTRF